MFVQSFETGNLRALDPWLKVPLVQLLAAPGTVIPGDTRTYAELATPAGLRGIARYAEGVGPSKDYIVPRDAEGNSLAPTTFVRDAHAQGSTCTRTRSGARTTSSRSSCARRTTPPRSAT